MKVKLEENYKNYYTISDLERAKAVIKWEKENDEESIITWAEYAVNEALKGTDEFCRKVICAEARTAKNCRVWNAYSDKSETMDVWITATAKTVHGFIEVGAYLSDIWQTGSEKYKHKMNIQYYAKCSMK